MLRRLSCTLSMTCSSVDISLSISHELPVMQLFSYNYCMFCKIRLLGSLSNFLESSERSLVMVELSCHITVQSDGREVQHCTHSNNAEGCITIVILLTIYDTPAVKKKKFEEVTSLANRSQLKHRLGITQIFFRMLSQ